MIQESFGLGSQKYQYYRVLEYFIDWYVPENNYQDQDEAYNWIKSLTFKKKPTSEALIITYLQRCKKLTAEKSKEIFNRYNEKRQTYIRRIDRQRRTKAKPSWYDKYGRTDTKKLERFLKQAKQNNQILELEIPIRSEFACGFDILENWKFYTEEEYKLRKNFESYVESELTQKPEIIEINLKNANKELEKRLKYLELKYAALEQKYQEEKKNSSSLSNQYKNASELLKTVEEQYQHEQLRVKILNEQLASLQAAKRALETQLKESLEINNTYQESTIQSRKLLAKLKEQDQLIGQMREVLKLLASNVIESLVEGGIDPDEFIKMTQDIKQGKIEKSRTEKQDILKMEDTSIIKQDESSDQGGVFPTFRRFLKIVTQLLKTHL